MLQEKLDLSNEELKSLVLKCPQIIGLSYQEDVEPKIKALQEKLGVVDFAATKTEILKKPASLELAVRGGA